MKKPLDTLYQQARDTHETSSLTDEASNLRTMLNVMASGRPAGA